MDNTSRDDELRPEYDLSQLRERGRGKYVERYREGTNLVRLDPDAARAFRGHHPDERPKDHH